MEKQIIYREVSPAYVTYWILYKGVKQYVKGSWAGEEVEDGKAIMVDTRED